MFSQAFDNGKRVISEREDNEAVVSLIAGGDFYAHSETEQIILDGGSQKIIEGIKPALDSCDFRIINFEAPMTDADTPIRKSGPNLKMKPGCMQFLKAANIDIVTLANNHIGDYGPEPVTETLSLLKFHDVATVGAGLNLEESAKPLLRECNGLKIAILNVAENEFGGATDAKAGFSPLDPVVNISQIKSCAEYADVTLVFVHGGNEYNPIPSPRMVKTYRAFIDAGADAVIGNHTHCPQGIELWQNKPIVYSTGDWLFKSLWADYEPNSFWWHGYMVKLVMGRKKAVELEVVPYTFGPTGEKIIPFENDQKERFCQYLAEISDIIPDKTRVAELYDAWTMAKAPMIEDWLNRSVKPPFDDDAFLNMLAVRNIFTCEAHNELAKNYLRIQEEERTEQAKELIPEIERLQDASFLF